MGVRESVPLGPDVTIMTTKQEPVVRYRVSYGRVVTLNLQPRKDGTFKALDDETSSALHFRTIVNPRMFSSSPLAALVEGKRSMDAYIERLRSDLQKAEAERAALDNVEV